MIELKCSSQLLSKNFLWPALSLNDKEHAFFKNICLNKLSSS